MTLRVDWTEANEKMQEALDSGKGCRVCGRMLNLQRAHTVGCKYDPVGIGPRGGKLRRVPAAGIVILCGGHHFMFDAYALDLRPFLTDEEWAYAVHTLGEGQATTRLSGGNA